MPLKFSAEQMEGLSSVLAVAAADCSLRLFCISFYFIYLTFFFHFFGSWKENGELLNLLVCLLAFARPLLSLVSNPNSKLVSPGLAECKRNGRQMFVFFGCLGMFNVRHRGYWTASTIHPQRFQMLRSAPLKE